MPTISYVSVEAHEALQAEFAELKALVSEFIASLDDQVDTKRALAITGIKSRTTLIVERKRPDTLLSYTAHGRSVAYSRASCIMYRRAQTLR